MKKTMIYHCETPLRAGVGSSLGVVDLPIQREKHTNFPKIEASAIKWALKDRVAGVETANNEGKAEELFGSEAAEGMEDGGLAGKIMVTSGRVLFFPVRTRRGLFAYITCPFVFKRFLHEIKDINNSGLLKELEEGYNQNNIRNIKIDQIYHMSRKEYSNVTEYRKNETKEVVFSFGSYEVVGEKGRNSTILSKGMPEFIRDKVNNDLFMVSDELFRTAVDMETETMYRTKIVDGGDNPIFTVEYLPEDTILYNCISDMEYVEDKKYVEELLQLLKNNNSFQLGADTSLGKGIVDFHVLGGEGNGQYTRKA